MKLDGLTREFVKELAEYIEKNDGEKLSSWEITFIDDMSGLTKWTEAQAEKIEEIHDNLCQQGLI